MPNVRAAHLIAVLSGVSTESLLDSTLLGGLMIAATSATGVHAPLPPQLLRGDARGVDAVMLFAGGHLALHADSAAQCLHVDIFVPETSDPMRALDVIVRRLGPSSVHAQSADVRSPLTPAPSRRAPDGAA